MSMEASGGAVGLAGNTAACDHPRGDSEVVAARNIDEAVALMVLAYARAQDGDATGARSLLRQALGEVDEGLPAVASLYRALVVRELGDHQEAAASCPLAGLAASAVGAATGPAATQTQDQQLPCAGARERGRFIVARSAGDRRQTRLRRGPTLGLR
jgi:hypothetical protein